MIESEKMEELQNEIEEESKEIQTIEEQYIKGGLEEKLNDNSIIAVNIKYERISEDGTLSKRKKLPEAFVLDLPERISQIADKTSQKYFDLIESFVYNTLSKKFQTKVSYCQIWIN